ncbi:DNA-binding transcriptional regulator, AcrR family [Evansella caseinilytica]|uniref:DNA-binding transcriptional regulator, AcrR family n=1 Tax=Evansella caseinilytica TaxID=1503961 RepID=A0A1H3UTV3_9BACI|nr:TetR/AcrR family transcriptional regulator [Evansella caseinilytica]SDZ65676.1 DNA-binding transcriptional regulator, AcrR family [Evansella caseinilytica]
MNGYERRKQKKAEQIYAAAFDLISKFGYSKVSINEIAAMAKVSPATIFNYFGTKEQLYAETLDYWVDKQIEAYENILASTRSFPDKIKEILLLEADNVKTYFDHTTSPLDTETSSFLQSGSEEKIKQFFINIVELGKQEGYIRPNYSEDIIQAYFKMYINEFSRLLQQKKQAESTQQIEQLLHLFFYGLMEKK